MQIQDTILSFYASDKRGAPPILYINNKRIMPSDILYYTPGSNQPSLIFNVNHLNVFISLFYVASPPRYIIQYEFEGQNNTVEIISGNGWLGISSYVETPGFIIVWCK